MTPAHREAPFLFQVIVYLLAAKFQCPKKVLLLRGNHEIRKVQQMFSFYK